MNKKIKLLIFILFAIISVSVFNATTFAQTATHQEWKSKYDVDAHHNFEILFTQKIDEKTIKDEYITVRQLNSQKVQDIKITINDNKKSIMVQAPENGYIEGETYILYIGNEIYSINGKALKNNTQMQFTIKSPTIEQFVKLPQNEYDIEEVNKIMTRIARMPQKYLKGLVENGNEIRLINHPLTDEPEYERLKGQTPRGWEGTGKTWEDVPGVGGNPIIVRIGYSDFGKGHGTLNLELHEIAHVVDRSLFKRISHSDKFKEILNREMKMLIQDHPNKSNMYYFEYPEEYFAEAFTYYYLNDERRAELKQKAPLTYEFFLNLEKNY